MPDGFLDIISVVGLFLAIEGAIYAGFPRFARRMAMRVAQMEDAELRQAGLFGLCLGVLLVWLVRG